MIQDDYTSTVHYAETCRCGEAGLRSDGFVPTYLNGPEAEQQAAKAHLGAIQKLRQAGPRYWAFHANGRHVAHVS